MRESGNLRRPLMLKLLSLSLSPTRRSPTRNLQMQQRPDSGVLLHLVCFSFPRNRMKVAQQRRHTSSRLISGAISECIIRPPINHSVTRDVETKILSPFRARRFFVRHSESAARRQLKPFSPSPLPPAAVGTNTMKYSIAEGQVSPITLIVRIAVLR